VLRRDRAELKQPRAFFLAFVAVAAALHVPSVRGESTCVDPRTVRVISYRNNAPVKPSPACRVGVGDAPSAITPCDAFRPAPGAASVWIEDDRLISPLRVDVVFDRACGPDLPMPVVPAGVVSVAAGPSLELVHVAGLEQGFERAVASPARVLMPLGQTIAVALDRQSRVAGVSRPFIVRPESTATFDWARAAVPAAVVTFDVAPEAAGEPFELLANGQIPPDVLVTHRGRPMAIWYGLTGDDVRVTVASKRVYMEPVTLTTDRHGVASAHGSIRPLPALTVNVTIPDEVRSALNDAILTISAVAGTSSLIRSADVSATQRFPFLPAQIARVQLEIGAHKLTRTVDLSHGDDRSLDFALQPYVVSGVVSHGDERAKARIEFRRDDSIHTKSDASGRYEVVLWEGGKYVAEVRLDDEPGVPSHLDLVNVDHSTTTLDFHIPRAIHRVRVLDDRTGSPIARALITVFNTWNDPVEGQRKVGRNVAAGADGEAFLPGLRPGTAEVHASAEGYDGTDPVSMIVGPGQPARTIEIRLRPRDAGRKAAVLLPDGSPAAGARLSAVSAGAPVWTATAGDDGSVAIPTSLPAQVLLASHPRAGLFVSRWVDGSEPLTVRLPAAAPPVVVKVLRGDGTPARFVPVVLWLNGFPVTDPALTVFTGSIAATDGEGVWIGRNLPAAALRIAAVRNRDRITDPAAIESLSTPIAYPWPAVSTIRTAD
jgi:Carboxypeptidase regulatory-like domain